MHRLLGALLAASLLGPVAAEAQRGSDRPERAARRDGGSFDRDRGPRGVEGRPEGGTPADGSRFGGDRGARPDLRPDRSPSPDGSRFGGWRSGAPRPDLQRPDSQRPDFQRPDGNRSGVAREDAGRGFRDGDRPAPPTIADDPGGRDILRGRDLRADRRDTYRNDGRGRYDDNRWRDDRTRNRFDPRGAGWRDDRRDGDRGWNDDRLGRRGSSDRWDRGWRGQSRYDWTRYRDTNRNAFHLPRYYAPYGWNNGYRRFGIGFTLSDALWGQNYWIDDPYAFRLPDVYGPFRWVRYYDDALLVDLRSGQVVDAVYGIFW